MSAAAARPILAAPVAASLRTSRLLVLTVLCLVAGLGVALLAISLVPSATLAGRLLGAAGQARFGTYSQELALQLDGRLRFAGVVLLALDVGLFALRATFEDLVAAVGRDLRLLRWSLDASIGVGLALVALAVRLPFRGQPMRYDEALTFNEFASRPLYYGLSFYPDPNNHLLNTLLMHVGFVALGGSPWVVRLPAVLAGALLAWATFWLGSLLFSRWAGVFAAALVATSSYLVEYSTNGRGYTPQALCFMVLLCLVIAAARQRSRSALLAAAVVAALGAYAVPTMLYGGVLAAAWLAFELRIQRSGFGWSPVLVTALLVALVAFVLYLPVVLVSGPDKIVGNRFVLPLGIGELMSELARTLGQTWAFWNRDVPLPFTALLVLGFGIGSWRVRLGLLALGVCLVMVLLQRVAPFERVWLFLLPLYLTIAAGGLAGFVDGRILAAAFGLVLGFVTLTSGSILSSSETGTFPDAEAVARTLGPRLAPDDAVQTTLPASLPELQYYFPRYRLPTDVLVRSPDEAQNLWVIAAPDDLPSVAGWPDVMEVQRFGGSTLYELRRGR